MHLKRCLLPLLFLLLALLACGPCRLSGPQVTLPCQPTISQAAAESLREKLQPIIEEKGPAAFTIQATSDEVSSFLALMLKEHPGESPVVNPRICFTPGRVHVAGHFTNILPFDFEGVVVAAPHLEGGQLKIELIRASAGSVLLPDVLLHALSNTINETLAESEIGIQFTAIEVGEGQIIISGHR